MTAHDLFGDRADEYARRRPDIVRDDLARAWGDPEMERLVRWPLHGAIGRMR